MWQRQSGRHDRDVLTLLSIVARAVLELIGWCGLSFRSRQSLQAEILFLRRQLALYAERGVRPRRIDSNRPNIRVSPSRRGVSVLFMSNVAEARLTFRRL